MEIDIVLGDNALRYRRARTENAEINSAMTYAAHSHKFLEILYLIEGDITYCVSGKYYNLLPGDIMIVRKNEYHTIKLNRPVYERRVFEFEPAFFNVSPMITERLLMPFRHNDDFDGYVSRETTEKSDAAYILEKIDASASSRGADTEVSIVIYFMEFLLALNKALALEPKKPVHANEIAQKMLRYIDENLTEKITLEDMEKKLNVSRFHLSHVFKESLGITLSKYVMEKKILYAEKLIEQGAYPSEAAQAVDYNYQNFYLNYKKVLGKSPRESKPEN